MELYPVTSEIYRLVVPFKDIYTTVFFLRTRDGDVLFDTATHPEDVDNYISPAMDALGITGSTLKYIVLSHRHGDHAGGLARVLEQYPTACVVSRSELIRAKYDRFQTLAPDDGESLLGVLQIVAIPGHSTDCLGLLDKRSMTLLTGDSLQADGVFGAGKWGTSIPDPVAHCAALARVRALNAQLLITSHNYHPLGYLARGTEEIERYIDVCLWAMKRFAQFLATHPELSDEDAVEQYNAISGTPPLGKGTAAGFRKTGFVLENNREML